MNKPQRLGWIIAIFALMILVFLIWHRASSPSLSLPRDQKSAHEASLIELNGIITSQPIGGFGASPTITPSRVKELLNQAEKVDSPLLLIAISSPGGSVGPTQEIYDHLLHFKEKTNKVIYVWMRDVAASGGYFIACPADKIIAMPSTITGSIGVIMQLINYEELLQKIGIEEKVIKSGQYKDMGSPGKPMGIDEEEMLQTLIDEMFEQFFQTVLKHRNIPEEKLRSLAQGQIFSGIQARQNGLVDEVKGWYALEEMIKSDMGWEKDIRWVKHATKTSWWSWLDARIPFGDIAWWNTLRDIPSLELQYRWKP